MTPHQLLRRAPRRSFLAALAFLLLTGLLSTGPAAAHNFTKTDGNDSPGKIDLKAVSVSHTSTSVVHKVQTFNAWTPQSLGDDSFFIIQIDKNNDRNYERCAFIFYTSRLRGSLTNCGNVFIRFLPVAKLSGTTAKITIPKTETGNVYWWAGVSVWDGPSPCANVCVDFAPNRFPDILHDLKPPVVQMTQEPLRVWESFEDANFRFPFFVSDANSGIDFWKVRRVNQEAGTQTTVSTGGGTANQNPLIAGVAGQQRWFHVEAFDRQGNRKIGPERQVLVPFDDDELGSAGVFSAGAVPGVLNSDAYGGTYTTLAVGETLTYTYNDTGFGCREFSLIGPGSGDWIVGVDVGGSGEGASAPGGGQRQTLFSTQVCSDTTITIEVQSGSGFAVDAFAI
jgi:hypothetical protein